MTNLIYALSFWNIVLGLFTITPCLMGTMVMDSPQAQNDPWAILVCYTFLTFPLVCWICAGLTYWFKSILLGLFPISEAVLFVTTLWMLSNE